MSAIDRIPRPILPGAKQIAFRSPKESIDTATAALARGDPVAAAMRAQRDTTMAEIAKTLGIGRATLYRHLPCAKNLEQGA